MLNSLFHRTLYVVNHSGGKDSQAMFNLLKNIIPPDNLVVIHAHLRGVEWEGTIDHIKNTIGNSEFHVVQARKSLFEMIEHRGMFPSPKNRQCTSDLKRGPITKKIIEICNQRGFVTVVNCMGLRAEESSARSKKIPFHLSENKTNSKRLWYEWLPIHEWSTKQVFQFISDNNQIPHWAYSKGMTRLSCCFCIMSSKQDLRTAAKLNPDLFQKYVDMEKKIGHTLIMPGKDGRKYLTEVIN